MVGFWRPESLKAKTIPPPIRAISVECRRAPIETEPAIVFADRADVVELLHATLPKCVLTSMHAAGRRSRSGPHFEARTRTQTLVDAP